MNNEYMIKDILITEKDIVANMATALNEASCMPVYKTYFDILKETSKIQIELFALASNNNWYKLEASPDNKIKTKYNQMKKDLK